MALWIQHQSGSPGDTVPATCQFFGAPLEVTVGTNVIETTKKKVNTKDIGMAVRVEPGYIEQLNEIYHFFSDGIQDVLCCHWCNPMEIFHDVFRVFTDEKVDHLAP